MARRESSTKNLLLMQDNLSDSTLGLYYRTPTTKERQAYINKRSLRQGKKFIDNSAANRVDFGKRILTGLREGDFERAVDDGFVPFSTEEKSKNYFPEWKEWMEANCSDVLTMLAIRVFELSVTPGTEESADDEVGEDLEKE
jgi:hypothetical protein